MKRRLMAIAVMLAGGAFIASALASHPIWLTRFGLAGLLGPTAGGVLVAAGLLILLGFFRFAL